MKNMALLIGTIVVTLVMIVGVALLLGRSGSEGATAVDQGQLLQDARHIQGPAEAPITIVEFSDFQCPACAAVQPLVKQILAEYPNQIRFVYRHFPLTNIHPYALTAARAAEVAAQDGKFWQLHDLLFERQVAWSQSDSAEKALASFTEYVVELGIDKTAFLARIEDTKVANQVNLDIAASTSLNLNATPTFFVNGQKTPAAQLQSAVAKLIATP